MCCTRSHFIGKPHRSCAGARQAAVEAGSEAELRAALSSGWAAVVQLTADIQLSAPLVVTRPARIQGRCDATGGGSGRCTLRTAPPGAWPAAAAAAAAAPLLLAAGPAAVVGLEDLSITGGRGGAVAAANHSFLTLERVELLGNAGVEGGGASGLGHARLNLVDCVVQNNTASVAGGGLYAAGGARVRLLRSVVAGNAAPRGGGVLVTSGASLTSRESEVTNNAQEPAVGARLGSPSAAAEGAEGAAAAGADVSVEAGAAAWFDLLPAAGRFSSSGGGEVGQRGPAGLETVEAAHTLPATVYGERGGEEPVQASECHPWHVLYQGVSKGLHTCLLD